MIRQPVSSIVFTCAMLAGMAGAAAAQVIHNVPVPAVRDAPFSADAEVLTKLVTFDGARLDQTLRSKYYRDSAGRVRREQTIAGLTGLNPVSDTQSIVTIVDPVAGFVYTIVGNQREVQRMRIEPGALTNAREHHGVLPGRPGVPALTTDETSLGTRQIEGLAAVGSRTATTIPAGVAGNEKPMEITEERWEAVDLKVLLLSRQHNPRSGDVEYRLTNIRRAEPPRSLFSVPDGYRIVDIPPRMDEHRTPTSVR
jgi:hypothetical protein